MDDADRRDLERQQEAMHTNRLNLDAFKLAFKEKKRGMAAGSLAQVAKKVRQAYKGPKKFEICNGPHIDQKLVKSFLPVGSYVWRARRVDSWVARYKASPTHSCKDTAWDGEANAIRECIRFCWDWHLMVEGLDHSHCPVQGVFTGDD